MTRNIACKIYYVVKIFMQSKWMVRHKTFFPNWNAGYKKMCKRLFMCLYNTNGFKIEIMYDY